MFASMKSIILKKMTHFVNRTAPVEDYFMTKFRFGNLFCLAM